MAAEGDEDTTRSDWPPLRGRSLRCPSKRAGGGAQARPTFFFVAKKKQSKVTHTHTDTHRVEKGVAILLSAHTHRAPPRARTFSSAATSSGPQPNCQFQHRNCRVTGTARCECSFLSLLELLRKIELKLKFYKKKVYKVISVRSRRTKLSLLNFKCVIQLCTNFV